MPAESARTADANGRVQEMTINNQLARVRDMDIPRIAEMIAECDDDDELTEVLAEVFRMLPDKLQRRFRDDISTIRVSVAVDDSYTRRVREERELREQQMAAFRRQRLEAAERRQRQLEAAVSGPPRSPEEIAELKARLERLEADPGQE